MGIPGNEAVDVEAKEAARTLPLSAMARQKLPDYMQRNKENSLREPGQNEPDAGDPLAEGWERGDMKKLLGEGSTRVKLCHTDERC